MQLAIYLSPEGDKFDIKDIDTVQGKGFKSLTKEEAERVHPLLGQFVSAQGKKELVQVLRSFQEIAQKDENITSNPASFFQNGRHDQLVDNYEDFVIKGSNGQKDVTVSVLHECGPYKGHSSIKGDAHRDTLEAMIELGMTTN